MTELNPQASLVGGGNPAARPGAALDANANDTYLGLSLETWVKVGVLAPLFVAVYWLVIRWLWDKTNPLWGEANWQHAVAIPLVGLYYLYINRDDLLRQPVEPLVLGRFAAPWRLWPGVVMLAIGAACFFLGKDAASGFVKIGGAVLGGFGLLVILFDWAIASLLFGLIMFAYGIWPGQNQFVQGCAMILTLFGVVLMLTGWRVMKYAWFPIAYLICGIPWPPLVYSYIASPLQVLAAGVAVNALRFTGVTAYRSGTKIHMASTSITEPMRTLNVAEACAGLRSLMTFITVGVAVAFLSARPLWQKIIITVSAIPIAIFCNVMRVAGQGLLDHYVSEQLSQSFAHQFVGIVMLIPAFFMILAVGWVLDHLFVEEADDTEKNYSTPGAMAASAAQAFPVGGVAAVAPPAAAAGRLVVDIPRRPPGPKVKPVPPEAQTHVAPRAVPAAKPPQGAKPQAAPPTAKPQAAPAKPAAAPPTAVTPPRPGIVPPRPGIVPPRPPQAQPPAQPQQKQPQPQPQPPQTQPQQKRSPGATQEGA